MKSSLAFIIPLIPALAAAPLNLEPRDITSDLLSTFKLFSQYAGASYCPGNNDSPNTKITCAAGNCPLVEASDTKTASEFENSFQTDTTGYVAVDNTHKFIVVAFRGSTSVRNWVFNGDIGLFPTDLCTGCHVHHGFWTAWKEIESTVLAAVKNAVAANPGFAVKVTGHSLGGAIATIAAAKLRQTGTPAALYSFGCPRVGDDAFAQFTTKQAGGNFRVTHTDDPVPRLPMDWLGYRHVSPEYWITRLDDNVATSDVQKIDGTNSKSGNAGTAGFNTDAHQHYLGSISACSGGFQIVK
ncbi:MAG: hypothetical protein M1816_006565 [Peltula sp. TS41687]|nr:MAG: hypothetical protein M1816_006565 [Peltula sp. TS41687]